MQTAKPTELWDRRWHEDPGKNTSRLEYELLDSGYGVEQATVLDIGCGSPEFSFEETLFRKYVGVDISAVALQKNMRKRRDSLFTDVSGKPEYELVRASAMNLPFREGVFDKAISCETVFHLGERFYDSILEMARCSSSIAFTAVQYNIEELQRYNPRRKKFGTLIYVETPEGFEGLVSLSEDEVRNLLKEAGFADEDIEISPKPYLVSGRKVKEIDSRLYVKAKKASGGT